MVYSEYNFSYAEYSRFLMKISDQSKYKNVTLNDFLQTKTTLPVISLRHDIDGNIDSALKIAEMEYRHNINATYFILHTAEYYGTTEKNYEKHNEEIIPLLKKLQDDYNHEIGWHNDLVTLDFIYGIGYQVPRDMVLLFATNIIILINTSSASTRNQKVNL